MPKITKVKIDDLVAASKKYAEAQVKKADVNKNGTLTASEAKKLAKDLQDNFANSDFKLSNGSVKAADVVKEFTVLMEAWAKASDKNGDGYLSTTEAKKLPKPLRDNFANYLDAAQSQVTTTPTGGYAVKDVTPKAEIDAQQKKFGGKVSYADALAKAIQAVATDTEGGLPSLMSDDNGDPITDPKKLQAAVKEALKNGEIQLQPADEEIPSGESPKDYWIFTVRTDAQGDNGLWGIVDRKTGETYTSNFN